jgi:hypothetical protein
MPDENQELEGYRDYLGLLGRIQLVVPATFSPKFRPHDGTADKLLNVFPETSSSK